MGLSVKCWSTVGLHVTWFITTEAMQWNFDCWTSFWRCLLLSQKYVTTKARYGKAWITTSNLRFLWMISDTYALAIKMLLKDNGDGDAHKDLFLQILIGFLHFACGVPELLASCCDHKCFTQWNPTNDHIPSGLHQHLIWRTISKCREKFSQLCPISNTSHLLSIFSPQKVNVFCLPIQSTASENFTIKIVGYWRFFQFLRL